MPESYIRAANEANTGTLDLPAAEPIGQATHKGPLARGTWADWRGGYADLRGT